MPHSLLMSGRVRPCGTKLQKFESGFRRAFPSVSPKLEISSPSHHGSATEDALADSPFPLLPLGSKLAMAALRKQQKNIDPTSSSSWSVRPSFPGMMAVALLPAAASGAQPANQPSKHQTVRRKKKAAERPPRRALLTEIDF